MTASYEQGPGLRHRHAVDDGWADMLGHEHPGGDQPHGHRVTPFTRADGMPRHMNYGPAGMHQHGDLAPHSHEVRADHGGVPLRTDVERGLVAAAQKALSEDQGQGARPTGEPEPCKHTCPNCLGCPGCCTCYDPAF